MTDEEFGRFRLNLVAMRPKGTPRSVEGDCWIWTRSRNKYGYGQFRAGGTVTVTHRLLWKHIVDEELADDMKLDHLCRNRACANPAHLEPVTIAENTRRGNRHPRPIYA